MSARYAIYFAPAAGSDLWKFGSRVIGYDAATGADLPFLVGSPDDEALWPSWTEEPRRYGFHGTLKAPFRLAQGARVEQLDEVASDLAARSRPFRLERAKISLIGSFAALVPSEECGALQDLAKSCLEAFEPLRAPPTEAERERRLRAGLSPRQVELMDRYGYPYVLDQFRFHMTLTGRLPAHRAVEVERRLAAIHAGIGQGMSFDAICIFEQPSPEDRFRIRRRVAFAP